MNILKTLTLIALISVMCGCSIMGGLFQKADDSRDVTILTYNIHTGKGIDTEFSLERISDFILECDADISGLQEIDRKTRRNPMDQPHLLSELTNQHIAFQKNLDFQGGEYGVAVLSCFPIIEKRHYHYENIPGLEQRGALAVKVKLPGSNLPVWFITTHLGTDKTGREQLGQVKELLEWGRDFEGTIILSGDFNQIPSSPAVTLIEKSGFVDLWDIGGEGPGYTFPSVNRNRRIDYLFVSEKHLRDVEWIEIPETPASDHLPLAARISLTY